MKTFRNPVTVHRPVAGYTHQIEVAGPQRWLVLSGQIGMDIDGGMPNDPIEQLGLALENVRQNLEAADMGISDIVKLTLFLVGEIDPQGRRTILSSWLEGHKPSMTLLCVAALANPGILVEIEALACRDVV